MSFFKDIKRWKVPVYEVGGLFRDLGIAILSGAVVASSVLKVSTYFYYAGLGFLFIMVGLWIQRFKR